MLCGCQFIIEPPRGKAYASPESLEIKMNVFMHMPPNLGIAPGKARAETALRQKCSLQTAFPYLTSAAFWPKWGHAKFAHLFAAFSAWPPRRPLALVRIVAEATSGPGSSSFDITDPTGFADRNICGLNPVVNVTRLVSARERTGRGRRNLDFKAGIQCQRKTVIEKFASQRK